MRIDFGMNVKCPARLDHIFVCRRNDNNSRSVRCKLVCWTLEADHCGISWIKPVEVTQGSTQVDLEFHIAAVAYVVGDAQLDRVRSKNTRGGIPISDGFGIAIYSFDDHRDVVCCARRSIPKLRDWQTSIVKNDVVVVTDCRRCVAHIPTCSLTKVPNQCRVDAIGIPHGVLRHPEITNGRPRVLYPTVRRIDQLAGTLGLRCGERIPTCTIVD